MRTFAMTVMFPNGNGASNAIAENIAKIGVRQFER